jgi:hypothetical protein
MTPTPDLTIWVAPPRGLSAHLHETAEEQGVPLTTLSAVLLAQASGWDPAPEADEVTCEGRRPLVNRLWHQMT